VVQCIKHTFPEHLVLQFDCTNTLNDQLLENVTVAVELPDGFELEAELPCQRLEYNVKGFVYLVIRCGFFQICSFDARSIHFSQDPSEGRHVRVGDDPISDSEVHREGL
jgi:hypothetical protein